MICLTQSFLYWFWYFHVWRCKWSNQKRLKSYLSDNFQLWICIFGGYVFLSARYRNVRIIPCAEKKPISANIYLRKVNNRNTGKRREICSKLTIKTPERRHWCRFGVFLVNSELIPFFTVSIVDFEQVRIRYFKKFFWHSRKKFVLVALIDVFVGNYSNWLICRWRYHCYNKFPTYVLYKTC